MILNELLFCLVVFPLFGGLPILHLIPRLIVHFLECVIHLLLLLGDLSELCTLLHPGHISSTRIYFSIIVNLWKNKVPPFLIYEAIIFVIERYLPLLVPCCRVWEVEVYGVLKVLDLNYLCNCRNRFAYVWVISKISWQRFLINFLNKILCWATLLIEFVPKLSVSGHKLIFN